ncbi:MAG: ATP-binding cassette domain-containing protein [Pseudomonadota bacterium]
MTARLQNTTVIRGGQAILNGATLDCAPGQLTAFCGPNGAGKTTALSVLTGALIPDRGEAMLGGHPMRDLSPLVLARQRAVVSQVSRLGFPFQVHEVVAMGRAPHHGTSGQKHDHGIVRCAIQAMDLLPLAERNYLTLSGGERQRTNIARALAQIWDSPPSGATRWLFLDEPTAALDLKYQISLMRKLQVFAKEGWGIVAVLHDLQLVKDYADHVVLFKGGGIVGSGSASDMLADASIHATFDLDAPYSLA